MKYLLWTGGLDSTYRLLYLLLIDKIEVTPIYFNFNIDGDYTRTSRLCEIRYINDLIDTITITYPYTTSILKPILYVNKINLPDNIIKLSEKLYYKYPGIAYSKTLSDPLEISYVMGDKPQRYLSKYISNNCIYYREHCEFNDYFRNIRFPIIHLGKCEILILSDKRGWNTILDNTISCWFPINHKKCDKCSMCKNNNHARKYYKLIKSLMLDISQKCYKYRNLDEKYSK